jgi:K+/H+ antiporter YhaU regulatory subunit KhtT
MVDFGPRKGQWKEVAVERRRSEITVVDGKLTREQAEEVVQALARAVFLSQLPESVAEALQRAEARRCEGDENATSGGR